VTCTYAFTSGEECTDVTDLGRVKEEKQKEEATRTMKRVELNNKMEESLREEKMNQEKRKVLSAGKINS